MTTNDSNAKRRSTEIISVRVMPLNYLVAVLIASFFAAFFLYLDRDWIAFVILAVAWIVVPIIGYLDRVTFDGRRIRRTGLIPRIWARLTGTRDRIKLSDVEVVQTGIIGTIRRGGNLIYTYRTSFAGKGKVFVISSANRAYATFIGNVLPRLNEELLDHRSIELRDHFAVRSEVRQRARDAKIPSADILEGSIKGREAKTHSYSKALILDSEEKALGLYRLANELRVSGFLPQAIEAFRRAVRIMPSNAKILFDFALCLRSYARSQKNKSVERRALAMVRLAERRAGDDGELLARIGEGYFQFGEWRRAASTFKKAVERAGEHFRTMIGLAEIALHEGKIAHVIHNFSAAGELAKTPAVRRWAKHEIEYFSRLNDDEEYMELEISRMNLLDTLESVKRSSLRIALVGFPAIMIGILTEDNMIANVGWAVSIISLAVWATMIVLTNMLSTRIPYDLVEEE